MENIKIYTDGACSGNPGKGGWGFAIIDNDEIKHSKNGFEDLTTNNKMELSAVIKGIEFILSKYNDSKHMTIYTDSAYTMNAMKDWAHGWKKRGWTKSNGKPIENPELIKHLYHLCFEKNIKIDWVKVKAHQKPGTKYYDKFNDYVDQLATGNIKPKD